MNTPRGALSGRTLMWEFSVRGFVLFVVLTATVSWILSSYIRRSLTEVRLRSVDLSYRHLERLIGACPVDNPAGRIVYVRRKLSEWLDRWDFAAVALVGAGDTFLVSKNGLVERALRNDLRDLDPERCIREHGGVRLIPVRLDGACPSLLAKVFRLGRRHNLGSVRYIVVYAYHRDVEMKLEMFQVVIVSLLFMCMAILYLAIGVVVKKASDELLTYSRNLEEQNAELRATKQHLLHTSKLAMLGELSASVAHEIRNPLAAVSAGLQLALRKAEIKGDEEMVAVLSRTGNEIERLGRILTTMLKFSRPGDDRRLSFSLDIVVEKVLLLVKKRAKDLGVRVEKRMDAGLPEAWGDPAEIEQVVLNLVLNALQAMEDGGTLTLVAASEGDDVVLEVRDSGPGVPPEILARIFKPFVTGRSRDGTGLGLSISKRIVEEHGGILTIENLEKGALARLVLPTRPPRDDEPR